MFLTKRLLSVCENGHTNLQLFVSDRKLGHTPLINDYYKL